MTHGAPTSSGGACDAAGVPAGPIVILIGFLMALAFHLSFIYIISTSLISDHLQSFPCISINIDEHSSTTPYWCILHSILPWEHEQVCGSATSFIPWHGHQLGRAPPTQVRASSVGVPVPKDSEIHWANWLRLRQCETANAKKAHMQIATEVWKKTKLSTFSSTFFLGFPSFSGLTDLVIHMIGSAMIWKWIFISHRSSQQNFCHPLRVYRSSHFNGKSRSTYKKLNTRKVPQFNGMMVLNTVAVASLSRSITHNRSQIMLDPNRPLTGPRSFFQEKSVLAPDKFLYFSHHGLWMMLRGHFLSSPEMSAKCRGSVALR